MDILQKDLRYIWHPCSQMKDFEELPPLLVTHAKGSYLYTAQGKYIDANASWWSKNLGHCHPRLKQALIDQANRYEHAIFANTTSEPIIALSERIGQLCPGLSHVNYASDGSSAVDMALKLSVHAKQIQGQKRWRFVTFENSYHGETGLALSVSDVGLYRDVYRDILLEPIVLKPLPYCSSEQDPLWQDCSAYWPNIEAQLEQHKHEIAAIIIEPILQGACAMKIYSPDLLRRINQWAKANDVYVIVDEILTGFGRLGAALACDIAGIKPNFICLGKGLTAGYLPLSAVLIDDAVFDLFYDDYAVGKNFLHSHTHAGNALAASVALEVQHVLDDENIYQHVQENSHYLYEKMNAIAQATGRLENLRHFGWMIAADLKTTAPRGGRAVFKEAIKRGALLRPLGNTLYWLLPLNCGREVIDELASITHDAITACDNIFA